ncbi:MAG: M23 family metallopeptidase [Sphingobium sp.]|nr:M23 family metallopeptidase [Sphingobium sp.]
MFPGDFRLFERSEFDSFSSGGAAGAANPAVRFFKPPVAEQRPISWRDHSRMWAEDVNLVPDLGQNIGSLTWFRGLGTCFALCLTAISLKPDFAPLPATTGPAMTAENYDEMRSHMVTSLAMGADSGRHMGPTDAAAPLTSAPERPSVTLSAAIGAGDSLSHALSRAGVSSADSKRVIDLLSMDIAPGALAPGTRLDIVLGRRASRSVPRPLDQLSFRARMDLAVDIKRENGTLTLRRTPIAVDNTPLRIRGIVTESLYEAARAAGALPSTIQSYLRVIGQHVPLSSIRPGTKFDIVVSHRRAATGETETGELIYGGLQLSSGKKVDVLKWAQDGKQQWFEASGVGQKRPGMARPVAAARLSSGFGMRRHPILGYSRLHAGTDYAAPTGTPIYAVSDGRVAFAGRHGGHGNYVKLSHNGNLATGYAHMSRIAVQSGQAVRRGQVIGYVGSTGLSTGPHLHYEVYRNGSPINPASVKFEQSPQLAGNELQAFRNRLAQIKAITNNPSAQAQPAAATASPMAIAGPSENNKLTDRRTLSMR